MPDNKLSAKEAALIAQARAQLGRAPAAPASAQVARVKRTLPAAATEAAAPEGVQPLASDSVQPLAPEGARPASALSPAERVAALMAAARAETEQLRLRQRRLYIWAPLAFMGVVGLWTLLWMWRNL